MIKNSEGTNRLIIKIKFQEIKTGKTLYIKCKEEYMTRHRIINKMLNLQKSQNAESYKQIESWVVIPYIVFNKRLLVWQNAQLSARHL